MNDPLSADPSLPPPSFPRYIVAALAGSEGLAVLVQFTREVGHTMTGLDLSSAHALLNGIRGVHCGRLRIVEAGR